MADFEGLMPRNVAVELTKLIEVLARVVDLHGNGYDGFECTHCGRGWYDDNGQHHLVTETLRQLEGSS